MSFGSGRLRQDVLTGVSITCCRGETCALVGPSGSGKTTLLSILGGLLSPSSGALWIDGERVDFRSPACLTQLRRKRTGFVFQQAQLLPFLTIKENLVAAARIAGICRREIARRSHELLCRLGIEDLADKKPAAVSGGERQRAAVARAMIHRPALLLADEPTASLDWESGRRVIDQLTKLASDEDVLLITVTHDTRLLGSFQRTLHIDAGKVLGDDQQRDVRI